jgi:hypothetical protein
VSNNFAFRGAEDLRGIMLEYGLDSVPMWATEFGWIRDPDADGFGVCKMVPEFNNYFGWMLVTEPQQADYLSRAFAYADTNWYWMEALFVWNLDWHDQGWTCDHIRYFSLRHVGGDAAAAYDTLKVMDKSPGPAGCRLLAEPTVTVYLAEADQPLHITGRVALVPTGTLELILPITQGMFGQPLTYTTGNGMYPNQGADPEAMYPTGSYTALLTFAAAPSYVVGSPQTVSVVLIVVPELNRHYLPVVVAR